MKNKSITKNETLCAKHKEFVRQYFLCNRNASEAYRRTYPKQNHKNADVNSAKIMVKAGILSAISKIESESATKFEITQEKLIKELSAIAFGNMADLFDWDHDSGQMIPKKNLTRDQMKFIDSINVEKRTEYIFDGNQKIAVPVVRMKLGTLAREKVKAIELIAKMLGLDKAATKEDLESENALTDALKALDQEK